MFKLYLLLLFNMAPNSPVSAPEQGGLLLTYLIINDVDDVCLLLSLPNRLPNCMPGLP